MNRLIILLFVFAISFLSVNNSLAVVAIKKAPSSELSSDFHNNHLTKKELKKNRKAKKKQLRLEKRLKKFQQKLKRKSKKKKRFFGGVTDEPKFQLGILLFLGGLIVYIFDFLPFVGWLIGLVAGLLVLSGLVLMLWALLENY